MRGTASLLRCLFALLSASALSVCAAGDGDVLAGTRLGRGFDMGVDSSEHRTDWVSQAEGAMKMAYPPGQDWGAVFITVGKPKNPPRPSIDLSGFNFLLVEMRGGLETKVSVGIKDNRQPDDGTERKVVVPIAEEYRRYVIPLKRFRRANIHRVYVAAEIVFDGPQAGTVWLRGVKYLNSADETTGLMLK